MADKRRWQPPPAARSGRISMCAILDEDALVEVLRAAQAARVLGLLASSSKQLCRLARRSVPLLLRVREQWQASLIIRSHTRGRPAFSGCRDLWLHADDLALCCMAVGVLDAAQEWTALKRLQLSILADPLQQQQEALTVEYCACSILKGVPSLQQLRRLELTVPSLGASSAQHIMQLTQLTCLQLTASGASVDAAADLGAMSAMTNLVELHLNWALAPHLPAGLEGPYCLPSSLVELELSSRDHSSAAPMACWVAQLPGCPQLQHLVLDHGKQQHLSAHPQSVVGLLAQYNRQLRTLASPSSDDDMYWGAPVVGLPGAGGRFYTEWWPDAALATLTGLECLQSGRNAMLNIREQAQWQHLVQLTALRKLDGAMIWCVPELLPSNTLRLVKLVDCGALLGGYALGRLLLACPLLEQAAIAVYAGSLPAQGARLPPHPKLVHLRLWQLTDWGEPEDCAALFAQLAPVLSGVSTLELHQWPLSDTRVTTFPDLSSCTALTALAFSSEEPYDNEWELPAEQEYFLSMVSPLKQLRRLEVSHAPRVNARVAFALQPMLPQLQHVELQQCGTLLPVAVGEGGQQPQQQQQQQHVEEQAALEGVLRLLRPGLLVAVRGKDEDGE